MLSMLNLKLYRKVLVLCLLSIGLFIASSVNQASAVPCCSSCDTWYLACVENCNSPTSERNCVELNCDPYYNWCSSHCSDSC